MTTATASIRRSCMRAWGSPCPLLPPAWRDAPHHCVKPVPFDSAATHPAPCRCRCGATTTRPEGEHR